MDGHTMDELYHHRAVLFSIICNEHRANAWKSRLHSDGTMLDGMFVVGLDSEFGPITYHYLMSEWNLFKCDEIPLAPEWDGVVGGSIRRLEQMAFES